MMQWNKPQMSYLQQRRIVLLSCVLLCCLAGLGRAAESEAGFPLVHNGQAAPLVIDAADAELIGIAAKAFAEDVEQVTGVCPEIRTEEAEGPFAVYAGTLGHSRWIDALEKASKLDCGHIRDGAWESFVIAVVDAPFEGVRQALVVAGSDRRGTAYGLFELSRMIGVSPWVWWADVRPDKQENLYIDKGLHTFGPPSVKYRGIFLNDEDWGLHPWAAKTYEPETGDIGPKTYARICQLLLRLKANHLWPAMHNCTGAFNRYPDNKVVADRYGILMGSAHCEPLLFNNASEWNSRTMGPWRYDTNREGIVKVLDQRVKENGRYENVYTVGLRGIHDSGMAGDSLDEKTKFLAQAIADQRRILSKYIDTPITEIPQVFIPYKEVLPIYENGLEVPEDITLMWVDDNYGYLRQFSTPQEQRRSGGGGIYHHISYLGGPRSYLWLNSTPPALLFKEFQRAWETNARRIWILNVGDIKPGEIAMEFALQMAWDITKWNEDNVQDYLAEVAARDFGREHADEIAAILREYYRLNFPRKPEYLDFTRSWNGRAPIADPTFSLIHGGDECQARIDAFEALRAKAGQLARKLPAHKQDAYFQLVLYPVAGAAEMNKKMLYAYKSRAYARQGRISSNRYATLAAQAYQEIERLTAVYNDQIAGGKWKHMMSSRPMSENVFSMPPVLTCKPSGGKGFAVAIEGQARRLKPTRGTVTLTDPKRQSMEIVLTAADAAMSGGLERRDFDGTGAVGLPNGSGNRLSGPSDAKAVFAFDVEQDGNYTIHLTVNHPSPDDDSWYIQIDDGPWDTWNNFQSRWQEHAWKLVYLPAGRHTLTLAAREDGAWLGGVRLSGQAFEIDSTVADSNRLPTFNRSTRRRYFIDLIAVHDEPVEWEIRPSAEWIRCSRSNGVLKGHDERIWIDIDYEAAPPEPKLEAALKIAGRGPDGSQAEYEAAVEVFNEDLDLKPGTFVQDNGVISILAAHYASRRAGKTGQWKLVEGLGHSGKAMALFPLTSWNIDKTNDIPAGSPAMEYPIHVIQGGRAAVRVQCVPAFSIVKGRPMHCAVSIDGQDPVWVPVEMGKAEGSADRRQVRLWEDNVLRNAMFGEIEIDIPTGPHTLNVWGTDPSIVVDKIFIDFGGRQDSYLGPAETMAR